MIGVLKRHKIIFFALLIMLLLAAYLFITGLNSGKIPTRGVFVVAEPELLQKDVN